MLRTPNRPAKIERVLEAVRTTREGAEEGVGIVYVATIKLAEEIAGKLEAAGVNVALYHRKLPIREREATQSRFMTGEHEVIVATNAFGLGTDKHDIRWVLHFKFPDSLERYYQEAGRAGRDGKPARAALLYRVEDRRIQSYFLGGKHPRPEESERVYACLDASTAKTFGEIEATTDLGEKRVKLIVAQLERAGLATRRAGTVRRARDVATAEELASYLVEYERRTHEDKDRLDAMVAYAQTTSCRLKCQKEYFGMKADKACGHCDDCRDPAERLVHEPAHAPDGPTLGHAPAPTELPGPI